MARRRADGEGTIRKREFKRSDGSTYHRYFAVISDGYKPDGTRNRPEGPLRKYERDARLDLKQMTQERDERQPGKDMPLRAYLEQWLKRKQVRRNTSRSYEKAVRLASEFTGETPLDKLTAAIMQNWIDSLTERYKPSSIKTYKAIISSAFNDAVLLDYMATNILSPVKTPRNPRKQKALISIDEAQTFLNYLEVHNDWMYPLFYTFMTLGLRAGEIRGLIWDNYDPVEQSLEIEKQGSRYANEERVELKSEASNRILYLGSGMVNALNIQFRWQLKMSSGNESWNPLNLIFCNKQGGMFHETALHKAAISRQKRAGVRSFHLHDQRDFALSRLVAEGYDAATVSKIAGHSKVATTYDTYVRAFEDRQRQVRLSFPTTAPTKNARTPTNTTEALNPKNDYNE